ncbi:MAG TPA: cupin domain-containing protein [Noviherbaspirillum sp.]|nr:cupin domain-containing protein [Noviherbaspirillum sp.]
MSASPAPASGRVALPVEDAPPRSKPSLYPTIFAERMAGRVKHPLGDLFGLSNFGVNLTRLAPGSVSALNHAHSRQDEFIYVIEGNPTLVTGGEEVQLSPGMCAGFKAGTGIGHHLENRSGADVVYLEVGDRSVGDVVNYPRDDLQAVMGEDGKWRFTRKDGTPY